VSPGWTPSRWWAGGGETPPATAVAVATGAPSTSTCTVWPVAAAPDTVTVPRLVTPSTADTPVSLARDSAAAVGAAFPLAGRSIRTTTGRSAPLVTVMSTLAPRAAGACGSSPMVTVHDFPASSSAGQSLATMVNPLPAGRLNCGVAAPWPVLVSVNAAGLPMPVTRTAFGDTLSSPAAFPATTLPATANWPVCTSTPGP